MPKRIREKRKIAIVTNSLYTFGGGEKMALGLAEGLKSHFDITILNTTSPNDIRVISRKEIEKLYDLSTVRIIDVQSTGIRTKAFGKEPFVLRLFKPSAFAIFAGELRRADAVYEMSNNPLVLLNSVMFARLFGKKLVFGIHNFSISKILESRETVSEKVLRKNLFVGMKLVKYFHVINSRDFNMVKRFFPKANVRMIPNYITEDHARIGAGARDFNCLYVGRLEKNQKGIDLLCRIIDMTLAKNRSIKFTIVGKGGDGEELVESLRNRYKKNVRWLGFLSGNKLAKAYEGADLFVFPARYDTFSLVLLEAQGHGIPAVAFDIDGPKDILKEPEQGRLIGAFDTEEFSKAIEQYHRLWRNRKAYAALKRRISNHAYLKFGKDAIFKEWKMFFDDLMGR